MAGDQQPRPGQSFPPGNVSSTAGQQPVTRQPGRGPQGLIILLCCFLPAFFVIGMSVVVTTASRVQERPETSAPTTQDPRATPSSRPATPLQAEVPPLPDWLPPHDWEDLPTSSDKGPVELIAHPIYKANYPTGNCPKPPKKFTDRDAQNQYYTSMIDCLQEAWRPHLAAIGIDLQSVRLVPFSAGIRTPCGADNGDRPAFYCFSDRAIYISQRQYDSNAENGYQASETIIHEHFHHIQLQLGIFVGLMHYKADELEINRRLELQDICSTSRLQLTLNQGFGADDYKESLENIGSDAIHGSQETIRRWTDRGFYMTTLQGCNTWGVAPEEVA